MSNRIISPIAIDLGAKNTGVYLAHYAEGSSPEQIDKEGKVYQLEKDKYTLLMADRTAKRHQRRGHDRRQMAKRLFKLIWEKHFKLTWDKDVQQTVGFLLNRRGFSFLTEEYDADILSQFPQEAYELLPGELKEGVEENGEGFDFASALTEWVQEGEATVKKKFDAINEEPKRIRQRQVFIGRTKRLGEYCKKRIGGDIIEETETAKVKLTQLSTWILEEWREKNVERLPPVPSDNSIDLVAYLNKRDKEAAQIILDSLPDISTEETTLKKSHWNFKSESFDPQEAKDSKKEEKRFYSNDNLNVLVHLNHLAFAIHRTLVELQSGGRHRNKYFKEVKDVLGSSAHTHGYLKRFCNRLENSKYRDMDAEKLHKLIGHISNLELRPLRKFFNNKKHRGGDYWDEKRLTGYFEKWILNEWRINPQKDKLKADNAAYDYKKLRENWSNRSDAVVDFWLNTDSNWTIPPYQDNNNRRPPKCQSLILNPVFLDKRYSGWKEWFDVLKEEPLVKGYLGDYESKLKNLESSSKKDQSDEKKLYFGSDSKYQRSPNDLDARILQFIFDRIKVEDPLNLNEIYSHAKKIKQDRRDGRCTEETEKKLEKALLDSKLPEKLKDKAVGGIYPENSFLHLICKYYKQRQRARDGRIFIHPKYKYIKGCGYENTGHFDDRGHLLIYCNHKSRQKRYQSFYDIAGVFQISPTDLEKKVGSQSDEELIEYLKKFKGLKTASGNAEKAQKEHRGLLKSKMRDAINSGNKNNDLYKLSKSIDKVSEVIGEKLFDNINKNDLEKRVEKFCSVFSFAQINNIAFKERGGNANTCAVCSMDNAQRMQMVLATDGKDAVAKAQRLPAIPTRLIDGAVMRMVRIVGGAIAKDKWKKIKTELGTDNKVCVPIITESNRFEFEPSLKTLKGKLLSKEDEKYQQSNPVVNKDKRIKEASKGICPYTGDPLSGGDKDHIIPRSSEWGILNDEANLIWASDRGNKEIKKDSIFSLKNLKDAYKKKQFDTADDNEIKEWIIERIGNGTTEYLKFGPYRSFINLGREEQKAFRHALFLVGDPLRKKVIAAIDNRTRTFVNGTQRYFAEMVANSLYKQAKTIKKQHLLSFDYFGVEALDNTRGDGIHNLRKDLVGHYREDLAQYDKEKGQSQDLYSHLIDAQVAFCMMADAHRKEGSLGIDLGDAGLWSRVNKETGEIESKKNKIYDAGLFNAIQVNSEDMEKKKLERRKPDKTFFAHRSIHRDGIYAERYMPILVHKKKAEVRIGFDWDNSYELKNNKPNRWKLYFALRFNPQINDRLNMTEEDSFEDLRKGLESARFSSKTEYFYISLDVDAIHDYYIKNYNTAKEYQQYDGKIKFLRTLSYRTEKKKITVIEEAEKILLKEGNFKTIKNKKIQTLEEAEKVLQEQGNLQTTKKKKITTLEEVKNILQKKENIHQITQVILPVKEEWKRLVDEWEKTDLENDVFLRRFFREPRNKKSHEKVRKVFSLPIKTGEGKILLKRSSWNGENIFQIVNDSDSRTVDTKVFIPAVNKNTGEIGRLLSDSARSKNLFLLNNEKYYEQINSDIKAIVPTDWYPIELDEELRGFGIQCLEYCIDNNSRPQVRLAFHRKPSQEEAHKIIRHKLLKPKEKEKLGEQLEKIREQGEQIEYTGSGFTKYILEVLSPSLQKHYG